MVARHEISVARKTAAVTVVTAVTAEKLQLLQQLHRNYSYYSSCRETTENKKLHSNNKLRGSHLWPISCGFPVLQQEENETGTIASPFLLTIPKKFQKSKNEQISKPVFFLNIILSIHCFFPAAKGYPQQKNK